LAHRLTTGCCKLQNGHLLVTHEKKPAGLFELGPPGGGSLGIGPAAYLPHGERFSTPGQLVATAWWPLPGSLREDVDDLSDLAVFDDHLYLLSDKSRCLTRLARRSLGPDEDLAVDRVWTLPGSRKAEGVVFRDDGACYVGFGVDLRDEAGTPNLLLATLP
jgi:uncharacterized protein YjiK